MGEFSLLQAIGRGLIDVTGPPRLVKALETWGGQTPFAGVRPAVAR